MYKHTKHEMSFQELIDDIPSIGFEWHKDRLIENTKRNLDQLKYCQSIKDIQPRPGKCLIVSAGPSLYRQRSLTKLNGYKGTMVAVDGGYIQCLKAGVIPDYIITIDPHPTRIVRWFGDPALEENSKDDDYFERQDLDVSFRENALETNKDNIKLVDRFNQSRLVIACSAPQNVVGRTFHMKRYWFAPLVDDPDEDGLTRQMVDLTGVPAMNSGGTAGNCAWVFAYSVLNSKDIACVGMDYGYYMDTPLNQTQEWNMLKDHDTPEQYFPEEEGYWGKARTSPTYSWYRQNLRDLMKANDGRITNCTEGGLLTGFRVENRGLDEWLKS